ncbi:hypothetical protein K457DRAFT_32529 [Linnemannia elongata AG-77]|uniref:Uncharacterized protein n=1 Tax=Linnemannia elongata AG-77 TaxID=1314771 RepID=A0A197JV77_9FUNG|nr:hypothetical protein K457DRAFT_32529 [Linnemannia elongata AG-77]
MVSPFAFARQHHSAAKLMIFFLPHDHDSYATNNKTVPSPQTKQNKTKQQAIVSCKQLPTLFCYSFFFFFIFRLTNVALYFSVNYFFQ